MLHSLVRLPTALVASSIVLALATGCGSGGSTADKGDSTQTTAASAGATTVPGGSGASATTVGSSSSCVKDGSRLSGSSTVIWTADSKSEHQGSEATAQTTMLLDTAGVLAPSTLTVKVGEVFTFGLAAGNKEIAAIAVGCATAQTVYGGKALAAQYITAPGTYEIVNEIGRKKLGTVTVQ